MANQQRGAFYGSVEEYVKARGGNRPIKKILVANNGIGAVKAIRSMRKWAYETFGKERAVQFVAMATPEDLRANAEYIRMADEVVDVPGGNNSNNYANVMLIVEIAERWRVDAVWAGWGHASENPLLPDTLAATARKIVFIGPSGPPMRALGDKIGSTIIAQSAGVPTIAWNGDGLHADYADGGIPDDVYAKANVTTAEKAAEACERIGFPVMIKASEGGGGKGIRMVGEATGVAAAYRQVASEVPGSPIFVMRLAPRSRHLEVQLLADTYGEAIALNGRDCSVQRRHQKIIEEGPAVVASAEVWGNMERSAVQLAKKVGYCNAGTVEYLYSMDAKDFFFLELNPRLQVEHPVTEMITKVNLPAAQLQVAMGLPLHMIPDIRQMYGREPHGTDHIDFANEERPPAQGHCIAVRITAENPDQGFQPTSGTIKELNFRSTPDVWGYFSVDSSGLVHEFADSQFGHLFARGGDRETARRHMTVALKELSIRGDIRTTVEYIGEVLQSEDFIANRIDTGWLDVRIAAAKDGSLLATRMRKVDSHLAVVAGAVILAHEDVEKRTQTFLEMLGKGLLPPKELLATSKAVDLIYEGVKYSLVCCQAGPRYFTVTTLKGDEGKVGGGNALVEAQCRPLADGGYLLVIAGKSQVVYANQEASGLRLSVNGNTCVFTKEYDPACLDTDVAGKLARRVVADGARVKEGEAYCEVEVMKMYMPLCVRESGVVRWHLSEGAALKPGDRLATLELQTRWGVSSEGMDSLLEMSGLDAIKADFLSVAKLVVIDRERGYDPSARSFNVRLEGNPGTGKTTVARLYYRLLKDLGVFASAEERAADARAAAEAAAKKKADDAAKARQDAERRAFQSAGLPYTAQHQQQQQHNPPATPRASASSTTTAAAAASAAGFVETAGTDLADNGVGGLKDMLKKIREAGGGVLFVDEAYTLEPQSGGGGKQVLNFLLAEIENRRGELVVAFAGYAKNMETLFEFNEGLPSRFPKVLRFEDYSDALFLEIFKGLMAKKKGLGTLHFGDSAEEQEDPERWAKVAVARLGRRRGSRGFGNARAVRVLFDQVLERQASRLSSGDNGNGDGDGDDDEDDPYELTKPDLLGRSVSSLDESESWRTLRDMVGLGAVKNAVLALAEVVQTNRVLEEAGKPPRDIALNRCMLGNPGTGKTTVAMLFAGILADLGLLSKGEVVLKTASDFVGSVLGESESKTRAILKAAEGCVLVIDEAYSLRAGSGVGYKGGSGGDPYRTAVVDTLVEQVQNVPGEDRCVLLLGYRAEMEEFMRDTNPGLARRFALDNAFSFEDYKDEELLSILRGKLRREHLTAGVDALMAAADVLRKKRNTASHFGNGGEVANLLSEAKLRKEKRRKDGSLEARLDPELLPQDFDPEYGVGPIDGAALEDDLFGDLIGCADIKLQLTRIRSTLVHAQRLGRDPREAINLNFRFTGAPGTGKTTVAQRVGRMFKQLSVIHSDDVVSCSPSDFTTGFVGQAALKTKEILDKAIGKVLFIDEAYGLNPRHGGGSGSFMQEVVDQLTQCLTDDKYKGNMVVVVAGYAHDIDELMEFNPGLASRFPETLHFPNFGVDDCCRMLESSLKRMFSTDLAPEAAGALQGLLLPVLQAPRFGNGRTITDLTKRIFTEIGMRMGDDSSIGQDSVGGNDDHRASVEDIRRSATAVLQQMARVAGTTTNTNPAAAAAAVPEAAFSTGNPPVRQAPQTTTAKKVTDTKRTAEERDDTDTDTDHEEDVDPFLPVEDIYVLQEACEVAGMPPDSPDLGDGEVGERLRRALVLPRAEGGIGLSPQQARAFLRKLATDRAGLSRLQREEAGAAARPVAEAEGALAEVEAALREAGDDGEDEELLATLARVRRAKEAALKKAREERERQLVVEAASRAALARMGVCPAGFQWIRQGSGWRCGGGTHHVSGSAVAAEMARGGGGS